MKYALLTIIILTGILYQLNHSKPLEVANIAEYGATEPVLEVVYLTETARISCYVDKGLMASGKYVYPGAVATSDRSIPMGTEAYIEGVGLVTIDDKTNKRIHNEFGMLTLDVWMTEEECAEWGLKYRKYIIL